MAPKKALVVVTSVEKYPHEDKATGLWFGEAVHFTEAMEKAGFTVDICSPKGGYVPIDPSSLQAFNIPVDWKYYACPEFRRKLGASLYPDQVNADEYCVIYFAGGHGTLWDFYDNPKLQEISRKIYEKNGVVSSVCHGAVGLLNIKLSDGSFLIKGKKVSGFSNKEEAAANMTNHVPFLTEDELKKRGGIYQEAPEIFTPFAVADGRLVSGQNPASAGSVAEKVLQVLGVK